MSAYTTLKKVYVFLFARKVFFPLNRLLYKLSVHGMGVLNYENGKVSGEISFIEFLIAKNKLSSGAIFDVGANVGNYSILLLEKGAAAPIYAFEPHPATFAVLSKNAAANKFQPLNMGLGEAPMNTKIYDSAESDGSEHARKELGRFSGFNFLIVPDSNMSCSSNSFSFSEPSHQ